MIERGLIVALVALAILAIAPRVSAPLFATFETLAHASHGAPAVTVKDDKAP